MALEFRTLISMLASRMLVCCLSVPIQTKRESCSSGSFQVRIPLLEMRSQSGLMEVLAAPLCLAS